LLTEPKRRARRRPGPRRRGEASAPTAGRGPRAGGLPNEAPRRLDRRSRCRARLRVTRPRRRPSSAMTARYAAAAPATTPVRPDDRRHGQPAHGPKKASWRGEGDGGGGCKGGEAGDNAMTSPPCPFLCMWRNSFPVQFLCVCFIRRNSLPSESFVSRGEIPSHFSPPPPQ
jgi:hypothetical protein